MARVAPLVAAAPRSEAALALLRDKQILLSDSGRSFVMYERSGSSWVAMSDPVGDPEEFRDLLWKLRDRADHAAGELVVYSITPRFLPLYIDLGLSFFKLGEAARVPLTGFSLEGSDRADLRKAVRRLERDGGRFEVVRPPDVTPLMPRLKEISDAWLAERNAREKRFSLGFFEPAYIAAAPVAVVRVGGEIVAFANVVASEAHEDMSVDLMRYVPDAPRGMMDALFGHLMLWGAAEGYQWFNLGMAPFSGLDVHAVGGAWRMAGHALFRYGEHFYNFQGLRQYKEKFQPVWEPRYLAAPPGIRLPGVVADVTALISGGLRGAIMR
jgi:phosphatidylglycerol lysyltransferase